VELYPTPSGKVDRVSRIIDEHVKSQETDWKECSSPVIVRWQYTDSWKSFLRPRHSRNPPFKLKNFKTTSTLQGTKDRAISQMHLSEPVAWSRAS
jgi:hypothetical protein